MYYSDTFQNIYSLLLITCQYIYLYRLVETEIAKEFDTQNGKICFYNFSGQGKMNFKV